MSAIDNLAEFVDWFNNEGNLGGLGHDPTRDALYAQAVRESFKSKFITCEQRTHIGVSELGRPTVLLGLKKLGFPGEDSTVQSAFNFHYGDWFEAFMTNLMEAFGLKITGKQHKLYFQGLTGHIDGFIGGELIVEIKSLSAKNFSKFTKYPSDDLHGYMTQLSVYMTQLGTDGVWLCFNKQAGLDEDRLVIVRPPKDDIKAAVNRAREVVYALERIETLEIMFNYFEPPDPVAEVYKKQPTGYYLIPESMQYSPYADCFYEIEVALNNYKKETRYVCGILDTEESISRLTERWEANTGST